MIPCSRCAMRPDPIPDTGTLCIAPPLPQTHSNLRALIGRAEIAMREPGPNLLVVPLAPGVLGRLADALSSGLSQGELRDTRSLVIREGMELTLADLGAMQPLATLLAQIRGEWFTEMLREDRLICHFQPIVNASAPGEVFAYECLLRGVQGDGSLVAPERLYEAAREADMLFRLDRTARLTAIRAAAAQGLGAGQTRLFINFNPSAIYDPAFCLRSTVAAASEAAIRPEDLIFEVVESDQIEDTTHVARIVEFYRNAGFKVALDDLGSGYGSLHLLVELKPDYVKLDMRLIRGVDHDPYKAGIVRKLFEMARELGIRTVAEGIETEGEWSWVREHGGDYAQGYFFARPDSPPPRPRSLCETKVRGASRSLRPDRPDLHLALHTSDAAPAHREAPSRSPA